MTSYHEFSTIGGYTAGGEYHNTVRSGHWSEEAALAAAKRMGLVMYVWLSHHTSDISGRGRGGEDGRVQLI